MGFDFICVVFFVLCERKMVPKCFPTIGTARKIVERWFFQAFSKKKLPIFRVADVRGEGLPATMCSLLCTMQMIHESCKKTISRLGMAFKLKLVLHRRKHEL